MNTLAIATHLNILETAIVRIEEWANVLFVVAKGLGARFVSKKIAKTMKTVTLVGKLKIGEYVELNDTNLLYPVAKIIKTETIIQDDEKIIVSTVEFGEAYKTREYYKEEISSLSNKLFALVRKSGSNVNDRHPARNSGAIHIDTDCYYRVTDNTITLWAGGFWQYCESQVSDEIFSLINQIEASKANKANA
jgi:hypothetical protein